MVGKYWRIFLLHFQDGFQYRLRSLVWMCVGMLSAATLVIFWKANLASNPGAYSQNFDQILSYFVFMLLFGNVLISHSEGDIAQVHVYRGELSKYLLKPISYLWIVFNGELVWRIMSGAWGLLFFVLFYFMGLRLTVTSNWQLILLGLISCLFGHFISYLMTVCLGLSAIWLTSTKGLFELYEMVLLLLAGYLMPLSQLGGNLRVIAEYSPFAAIVYTPVVIFLGDHPFQAMLRMVGVQMLWLAIFYLLYRWMWEKGVRAFTGAGQ
jgi:ABC-2 type transport system permease protein